MNERYQRQISLPQIGKQGQLKLRRSRIAIIGCGALGTSVANNLARAGIGYLRIIDKDKVSLSNLHRQQIFTEKHVAQNTLKVEAAQEFLNLSNSEIKIDTYNDFINDYNIGKYLNDIDLVIDATDNFEARQIINTYCYSSNLPWVHGSAMGFEGRVILFKPKEACYRCLFPEIPSNDLIPDPSDFGVFGPITCIIGAIQATESIKFILNQNEYQSQLISIDIWNKDYRIIDINKNANCHYCN